MSVNTELVAKYETAIQNALDSLTASGDTETLNGFMEMLVAKAGVGKAKPDSLVVGKEYYNLLVEGALEERSSTGHRLYKCRCNACGWTSHRTKQEILRLKKPIRCVGCEYAKAKGESRA